MNAQLLAILELDGANIARQNAKAAEQARADAWLARKVIPSNLCKIKELLKAELNLSEEIGADDATDACSNALAALEILGNAKHHENAMQDMQETFYDNEEVS